MIFLHRDCFQANAAPQHSHPSLSPSAGAMTELVLGDDEAPKRQIFCKQSMHCCHSGP